MCIVFDIIWVIAKNVAKRSEISLFFCLIGKRIVVVVRYLVNRLHDKQDLTICKCNALFCAIEFFSDCRNWL